MCSLNINNGGKVIGQEVSNSIQSQARSEIIPIIYVFGKHIISFFKICQPVCNPLIVVTTSLQSADPSFLIYPDPNDCCFSTP